MNTSEQFTLFDRDMPSGKTSPAFCPPAIMLSAVSSLPLSALMRPLRLKNRGPVLAWSADLAGEPRGAYWMLNSSAWHNDASVCSLSSVLEAGPIPQKYYLSARACSGILRRAEKRGQYCGATAPEVVLHVDHINPVANGGQNDIVNLITSCQNCNLGKAAVPLSDASAIAKSRRQMELLQERREQLEMVMEWHRGISNIADDAAQCAAERWEELVDGRFSLNEHGMKNMRRLVKKYGIQETLIAIEQALDSIPVIDSDSVEKAFDRVGQICQVRKECGGDDSKIQARRLRGLLAHILNKRYIDYQEALEWIEVAQSRGHSDSTIKYVITQSSSYTNFVNRIRNLIGD